MQADLSGSRVAVTGGGGYLGASLIAALVAMPRGPRQVVRVSRRQLERVDGVIDRRADVRERDTWDALVRDSDVIFHLAGNTSVPHAEADPSQNLVDTVQPVIHLAAAAHAAGRVPRVVLASTSTVHGVVTAMPISEANPPAPATVYDLHKVFAEEALFLATRQGVIEGVALRLGNVYGPSPLPSSSPDRGVMNRIATAALDGAPIAVYGGGEYLRDYVYIDDVVQAFLLAGSTRGIAGKAYLIGSGTGTTLRAAFMAVAARAQAVTGKRVEVTDRPWPPTASSIDRRNYVTDSSAFRNATGWSPRVSLDEGVDRLVQSLIASR